jgi:hypothetical protein
MTLVILSGCLEGKNLQFPAMFDVAQRIVQERFVDPLWLLFFPPTQ